MARRLWCRFLDEARWSGGPRGGGRQDGCLSLAGNFGQTGAAERWTGNGSLLPALEEKPVCAGLLGDLTFSEHGGAENSSTTSLAEIFRGTYAGRSRRRNSESRSSSVAHDRRELSMRSKPSLRWIHSTNAALDGPEQQLPMSAMEEEEDERVDFSSSEQPEPRSVHLPKLENPTMDAINHVCGVLERQDWGPEVVSALEAKEIVLTPYLVQQIVQRMSPKDVGVTWSFFTWARERVRSKLSVRAYVAMLDALGRAKSFDLMNDVFALIVNDGYARYVWLYNSALMWCSVYTEKESADPKYAEAGLRIWDEMRRNKCKPSVVTYNRLIDLFALHGRHEEAMTTFRQMLEAGCPPNISTYNVLIRALGAAGQLDVATSLFDKLPEVGCKPNFTTYETLINLNLEAGLHETALKLFKLMRTAGLNVGEDVAKALRSALPDEQSLDGEVEESSTTAAEGLNGHQSLDSWLSDASTGNTVSASNLTRALERVDPASAEARLDGIQPALSHRLVVQVLRRLRNPDTAMVFFEWSKKRPNFKHNNYTYCTMINTIGKTGDKDLLDRVLKEMQDAGIKMNRAIYSSLITCYGRSRSVDGALELFEQMKELPGCEPDVVAYTNMIHLLAKHGTYEAAVKKFEEMQQAGVAPNSHTYTVLIYNLVKAGKVDEAVSLINEMPGLGCPPTAVAFATVIDQCVKKGQVTIAKDMYSRMEEMAVKPLSTTLNGLDGILRKAGMTAEAESLLQKYRGQRYWDKAYKSSTEKVAKELLFKDLATNEAELQAGSV